MIFVSSVTYNLAGDEKDRVRYLPTTVVSKVVSNNSFSMTDTIQSALMNGPGMRMRSFARWARNNGYAQAVGMQAGKVLGPARVDVSVVAGEITHATGETVSVDSASIGAADYAYWAEQWMANNHPDQISADYELDYLSQENTVFIKFPDGNTYTFQPEGFDITSQYLYANYLLVSTPTPGTPIPGPVVPVSSPANFPATSGWTQDSDTNTPITVNLNKTVVTTSTFSDGRPPVSNTVVTPSQQNYLSREVVYFKREFLGNIIENGLDAIGSKKTIQHNMYRPRVIQNTTSTTSTETLPGGVVKTTVVETTTESVGDGYAYRIDTQSVIDKIWSARKTFIYKFGTGNATLDAMFGDPNNAGSFFPFIPVRNDNRMLDSDYYGNVYRQNIKAYKKAIGINAKYSDIITSLEANESIGDIDYGYIVFGVALNTKEKASLKYVYRYFQLMLQQGHGGGGYDQWKADWNQADILMRAWVSWKTAQGDPSNPLFGKPEPPQGVYPPAPTNSLNISSSIFNFNMAIAWNQMTETTHVGLGREGARQGDVWWSIIDDEVFDEILYSDGQVDNAPYSHGTANLTWQDSPNTYRVITSRGLVHNYTIYKGKGVNTTIAECLTDPELSGFVLPLNEAVFRDISLVDATQMSQSNSYIVLNSYKVVKQKWYATSWFKVILVIIIIVITVLSGGSGAGSAGLLGPAAAVGASLGFTGLAAIIVGSIANALAAMLLTQLITMGAKAIFGEKVGAIVGAIASVIAVSIGTSLVSGQSMASSFSNLASAENILKLTVAAGKGFAEYISADSSVIAQQTAEVLDEYKDSSEEIMRAYEQNLGLGQISLDPLRLTESANSNYIYESSNVFLSRTLLTGSEIAAMTNDMLTNFTNLTLSQELS